MSESINILSLMVKDHAKIEGLINNLEKATKQDFETMQEAFNKFVWELEKHIFTEEKAIFTDYQPTDVSFGYKMLPELTKQHNYIVNTLNNWRADVRNKKMIKNVNTLKEFISKHKEFEENEVYPKLDQALSEEDKMHILAKINEII